MREITYYKQGLSEYAYLWFNDHPQKGLIFSHKNNHTTGWTFYAYRRDGLFTKEAIRIFGETTCVTVLDNRYLEATRRMIKDYEESVKEQYAVEVCLVHYEDNYPKRVR